MRKRTKVFLLLGCLAAACVLIMRLSQDDEPHYQGRSLTKWLLWYHKSVGQVEGPAERAAAEPAVQAVRAIGTNALPYLLKWIEYEPSRWRNELIELLQKMPSAPGQHALVAAIGRPETRLELADAGFYILRSQAAPAIPELTRRMHATNSPWNPTLAVRSLAAIGAEGVPPLMTALTNRQLDFHSAVIELLGLMRATAGTNLVAAVPLLVQCADESDPEVAAAAIQALGRIAMEPEIAAPTIIRALNSTNRTVRLRAVRSISRFRDQGRPAAPALMAALNDQDPEIRSAATNALLKIAPEVLTNTPAP